MSDVVTSGVKEVRHGLFRIYWKHSKRILRNNSIKIELCGSQLGRSVLISLKVYPHQYVITVVTQPKVVDEESIDGKEPSKKSHKLNESLVLSEENLEDLVVKQPKKVWIENAGSVHPNEVLELNNYNNFWEVFLQHETSEVKECPFMIWIDYGTNEERLANRNKKIAQSLCNQTYCDVQFQFKNGQSIGAHIVILSASSPVFADMFQSSLKKSLNNVVLIEDIEVQVFRHLLHYLYTSEVPQLTRSEQMNTMLLYEAAVKYNVEELKNECVEMLMMQLNIENAIEVLIWSKIHVIPELLEEAMEFTVKNCKMLCSHPSWQNLFKNHLELCMEVFKKVAGLPPVSALFSAL
jgi:speckle-type POZ protein